METCINYTDKGEAYFSSDERRWITRITRLAAERPDEVTILADPDENGGCIYARIPVEWVWVGPRPKRNLTDEQKQEIAERLRACRERGNDPDSHSDGEN